jgi:hypothetical protein
MRLRVVARRVDRSLLSSGVDGSEVSRLGFMFGRASMSTIIQNQAKAARWLLAVVATILL